MLDVHAPEHTPHTLADFFLHILTITIGLLIALGLESAVEWRHHIHLRKEADENILSEIQDNQRELKETLGHIQEEQKMLLGALAFLRAHAAGKPYDIRGISLGMALGSYSTASWQTAGSTGALSYMEYSHVKSYSAAYALQDQFLQLQSRTLFAYLQLQSYVVSGFDPDKLSPADADKARGEVQEALSDLVAMQEFGQAVEKQYEAVLKSR